MSCDEHLVERIRALLAGTPGLAERRMFGGVCFTLDGHMAVGVARSDLMVRVGPERYQHALLQPHAREMDFTGRPMRGYVFVGAEGTRSDADLRDWLEAGLAFVRSLPPKARKRA
jgi:TfoX/Sxy family transcriptional regulator of competence genes